MITKFLISILAFSITAYIVPGFIIVGIFPLIVISVVWGILCLLIKPILTILTLPINIMTLGLFTFVINAILLLITSEIVTGFSIANFKSALIAAVVLSLVNMFLSKVIKN